MAGVFENLDWTDGQTNPSGIVGTRIFWIPKTHIKAFPSVVASPTTADDTVLLDGDFVLQDGKEWLTMYSTQGKSSVTYEVAGEKDARLFLNKGTLKFPDISAKARAMSKSLLNSDAVIVVQLPTEEENFIVLGDKRYQTQVSPGGTSGEAPGSEKGVTFEVECYSVNPLPSYKGEIKYSEGSLDCATGALTPAGA